MKNVVEMFCTKVATDIIIVSISILHCKCQWYGNYIE